MSITRQALINWLNSLPDNSEVGIDEGGLTIQLINDPTVYLEVGGTPTTEEGSTIKPIAVCGACGKDNRGGTDIHGNCICGNDHWVELEDLDNPELSSYIEYAAKNIGCSIQELKQKVRDLNKETL